MIVLFLTLFACKEEVEPNGVYQVTVTGLESDCTDDNAGYQETFNYRLFYEGSAAEIYIDDKLFAIGEQRGCFLEYETQSYLEENGDGGFQWQIVGGADVQAAAGGCEDIPEGSDWFGEEFLYVDPSDTIGLEDGCTYKMEVSGKLVQEEE